MSYSHEIDALNAIVEALKRNNELLEQLLEKSGDTPKKGRPKGGDGA